MTGDGKAEQDGLFTGTGTDVVQDQWLARRRQAIGHDADMGLTATQVPGCLLYTSDAADE